MRHSLFVLALMSFGLPGCGIVLDLDSLQRGADGGSVDAARDGGSGVTDAYVPHDAYRPDTFIDTNPPDAYVAPPDAWLPPGVDGGSDAGSDAGSDGGSDAGTATTVGVGGTIVGLTGSDSITLTNGSDTRTIAAGTTTFSFRVATGGAYSVSVTAPSSLVCVVYRGQGTASADVTNLFVGCSTAVGLVSYFTFDGSMAAAVGSDFTRTQGGFAATYVADRAGQAAHALAAIPAGEADLVRPFNGDSTTIAPNATQATITVWAMVPSTLGATSEINLFGHYGPTSLSLSAQIQWPSGSPTFQMYFFWDGGFDSSTTLLAGAPLDRDHWHQIAIATSGPAAATPASFVRALFVDGVRQGAHATCCGWGNFTQYWAVGPASVPRDDIRLYDRMLSDAEIAAIYAAENVH